MRLSPADPASRNVFGLADPDAFGAEAPAPTLVIDTGEYAMRKIAALRCHRSQVSGGAFSVLPEADAARCLRFEHLRRSPLGPADDTFIERFATDSPS
jgi:LmbE family N-acetylglucosaminyl deacetylase